MIKPTYRLLQTSELQPKHLATIKYKIKWQILNNGQNEDLQQIYVTEHIDFLLVHCLRSNTLQVRTFRVFQCPRCFSIFPSQNVQKPVCSCLLKTGLDVWGNDDWPVFVTYKNTDDDPGANHKVSESMLAFANYAAARCFIKNIDNKFGIHNKIQLKGIYNANPNQEASESNLLVFIKNDKYTKECD